MKFDKANYELVWADKKLGLKLWYDDATDAYKVHYRGEELYKGDIHGSSLTLGQCIISAHRETLDEE